MAGRRTSISHLLNPVAEAEPSPNSLMLKSSPLGMYMLSSPIDEQPGSGSLQTPMYSHAFDASKIVLPRLCEVISASLSTDLGNESNIAHDGGEAAQYDPYDISDTFFTNLDSGQQAPSTHRITSGNNFAFNVKNIPLSSSIPTWPGNAPPSMQPTHYGPRNVLPMPKRKTR